MRILLLSTPFNSLTQAVYVHLKDLSHEVKLLYAVDLERIHQADSFPCVRDEIAGVKELLDACRPVSAHEAERIGMVDAVFEDADYYEKLHDYAVGKYDEDFIWEKQEFLEENEAKIEACKEAELKVMHPGFWDEKSPFHRLRREFVYKICPVGTPKRFG